MAVVERRMSLVTLGVADLKRAIGFYRDVVGWEPTTLADDVVFFDLGGMILGLWPHRELAADEGMAGAEPGAYHGFSIAYNARSHEEVDAIFRRLEEGGARIARPPVETDWGGYSRYFADPDNHFWEIAWNPFWSVGADGRISLTANQDASGRDEGSAG
jgi:catechol 2,3-dioxygenase-like lactoylglutathione lyase family enzyme